MSELDHDAQLISVIRQELNEHFNRAHDERLRMEDNLKEVMNARFESSKQRADKLESEMDALKEDVTEIRVDVAEIKNGRSGDGSFFGWFKNNPLLAALLALAVFHPATFAV